MISVLSILSAATSCCLLQEDAYATVQGFPLISRTPTTDAAASQLSTFEMKNSPNAPLSTAASSHASVLVAGGHWHSNVAYARVHAMPCTCALLRLHTAAYYVTRPNIYSALYCVNLLRRGFLCVHIFVPHPIQQARTVQFQLSLPKLPPLFPLPLSCECEGKQWGVQSSCKPELIMHVFFIDEEHEVSQAHPVPTPVCEPHVCRLCWSRAVSLQVPGWFGYPQHVCTSQASNGGDILFLLFSVLEN